MKGKSYGGKSYGGWGGKDNSWGKGQKEPEDDTPDWMRSKGKDDKNGKGDDSGKGFSKGDKSGNDWSSKGDKSGNDWGKGKKGDDYGKGKKGYEYDNESSDSYGHDQRQDEPEVEEDWNAKGSKGKAGKSDFDNKGKFSKGDSKGDFSKGSFSKGGKDNGKGDAMDGVQEFSHQQGEEFDNWWQFVVVTMQLARDTIVSVCEQNRNTQMPLGDLPKAFEEKHGSSFEKSRLGLKDMNDLVDLLSLWPNTFRVSSSSGKPEVSVNPGENKVLPLEEDTMVKLWRRSVALQPKKLLDCHQTYLDMQRKSQEKAKAKETTEAKEKDDKGKAGDESKKGTSEQKTSQDNGRERKDRPPPGSPKRTSRDNSPEPPDSKRKKSPEPGGRRKSHDARRGSQDRGASRGSPGRGGRRGSPGRSSPGRSDRRGSPVRGDRRGSPFRSDRRGSPVRGDRRGSPDRGDRRNSPARGGGRRDSPDREEAPCVVDVDGRILDCTVRVRAKCSDSRYADLEVVPLRELKDTCRQLGLKTGGRKADVVTRLLMYDDSVMTPEDSDQENAQVSSSSGQQNAVDMEVTLSDVNTLESNEANITQTESEIDADEQNDPMFQQMAQTFGAGGATDLLLSRLPLAEDLSLIFNSDVPMNRASEAAKTIFKEGPQEFPVEELGLGDPADFLESTKGVRCLPEFDHYRRQLIGNKEDNYELPKDLRALLDFGNSESRLVSQRESTSESSQAAARKAEWARITNREANPKMAGLRKHHQRGSKK